MKKFAKLIFKFLLIVSAFNVKRFCFCSKCFRSPEISNVQVGEVTDNSLTITWETDKDADSVVNYGLQPDLGIVRIPVPDRRSHSITLNNLEAGRTYYFRVISADENGNQGISADYKIQMSGSPQTGEGSGQGEATTEGTPQTPTVEEVVEQVNEIKDPVQLKRILNEVVKAIQGITEDLTIIGPPTVIPETNTALIRWTTDREANSEVLFLQLMVLMGLTISTHKLQRTD